MGSKEQADLVRNIFRKQRTSNIWLSITKKALIWSPLIVVMFTMVLFGIDRWISYQAQDQIYTEIEQVDDFDVAVVLGTSKYLGKILNEYYAHRIETAIELYNKSKVANFLLSGDNAHRSYNEPWTMKRDLLNAGVAEEHIYLDYAGFRTLDSVVRAKEIFDTDNFLIITQKFHCERALFIAKSHDINARCIAVSGPTHHSGMKVRIREVFARAKAILDLYIIGAQPKFLGPKEPIITTPKGIDSNSADTDTDTDTEI